MKKIITLQVYIPSYSTDLNDPTISCYSSTLAMTETDGTIYLGAYPFEIEVPPKETLTIKRIESLNGKIQTTYAEAERVVQQCKEEIARLSAITYQPREETDYDNRDTLPEDDIPF